MYMYVYLHGSGENISQIAEFYLIWHEGFQTFVSCIFLLRIGIWLFGIPRFTKIFKSKSSSEGKIWPIAFFKTQKKCPAVILLMLWA